MLRKMRWHFIASAMTAFFTVIAILLLSLNIWNYRTVSRQLDDCINMVTKRDKNFPKNIHPPKDFSHESPYMMRFFTVKLNNNNEVSDINQDFIASVSEDEATEYAEYVINSGKNGGYKNSYRYMVITKENGKDIIFLNAERELHIMKRFLLNSGIIAFFSLTAVFILVALLSKRTIMPYIKNIETQKRFITDAGHELKTPLTSISTSADILAMDNSDDEWINNIQAQSAKMSKLIERLVALSRLDEEQPIFEKTNFSLSDAVWEISEPMKNLAEAKGKHYTQKIEDNIIFNGDKNIVQQMVSILLDNAIRYSYENGIINLEVYKKGRKIKITVSNNCNTSNIDTERIFDRFYRPDDSRSADSGGTGIGLSIARAAVQACGGKINAKILNESEIIFTIILYAIL